jgi:exopolyphosphatase/guanosine-5'-triphosphate,3'-diphosphate pyrophosphatase
MKQRHAIIDIGSNAIRAVVYDDQTLGAPEIYNDKFRSDIASLLELDNIDIKHPVYLTLQYFANIFKQLSVTRIDCVATAILRNHAKGSEFAAVVLTKYGITVDIISGEREAYLTAAGLISGVTDANGIAADLGGGSLEFAEIHEKQVGALLSLPLGTKMIDQHATVDSLCDQISGSLDHSNICKNLYLIGGAFRFIGRYYMDFVRYPLKNLHNLEIEHNDFLIYLEKIDSIAKINPIYQSRRIDQRAITIAKALLRVIKPQKIVISNYGLKEGVRFVSLSNLEQSKDIIFERCKKLANFDDTVCKIEKYHKLIGSLVVDADDLVEKVIDLSVILVGFGKNIDRTLKANFIAEFILSSDIPFNHRQRPMLGLAISYAFSSKADLYINKLARRMLSKKDYYNSQIIGSIMRIVREVDGPEFKQPSFNLQLRDKYIEITTNEILPKAIFDAVCERLKDISYARKVAKHHV